MALSRNYDLWGRSPVTDRSEYFRTHTTLRNGVVRVFYVVPEPFRVTMSVRTVPECERLRRSLLLSHSQYIRIYEYIATYYGIHHQRTPRV